MIYKCSIQKYDNNRDIVHKLSIVALYNYGYLKPNIFGLFCEGLPSFLRLFLLYIFVYNVHTLLIGQYRPQSIGGDDEILIIFLDFMGSDV